MVCTSCGTVTNELKFCPKCGKPTAPAPSSPNADLKDVLKQEAEKFLGEAVQKVAGYVGKHPAASGLTSFLGSSGLGGALSSVVKELTKGSPNSQASPAPSESAMPPETATVKTGDVSASVAAAHPRFCIQCGGQLPGPVKFCPACGGKIE